MATTRDLKRMWIAVTKTYPRKRVPEKRPNGQTEKDESDAVGDIANGGFKIRRHRRERDEDNRSSELSEETGEGERDLDHELAPWGERVDRMVGRQVGVTSAAFGLVMRHHVGAVRLDVGVV